MRPEWAAAGTFPTAWRTAARDAFNCPLPFQRDLAGHVVSGLRLAHVISIDAEQVEALPRSFDTYRDSAAAHRDMRLPFDPVYISTEGAKMTRFDPPARLLGALVGRPQLQADDLPQWDRRQPLILPLIELPAGSNAWPATTALTNGNLCEFQGFAFAGSGGWVSRAVVDEMEVVLRAGGADDAAIEGSKTLMADAAELIGAIIYFLESANVALVEATPSRQERRAISRKGGRIALTVAIRQPKKRPSAESPASHPEWSHRWEVRGHYKHFPVGTRLADARPEKLVNHPALGQCRRIWCPPHVKGPVDRPLVPKIRHVVAGVEQ